MMGLAELLVTSAGILLIGALALFFFGPKESGRAELRGEMQEVDVTVKGGYSPSVIRVRQGVPLRIAFNRQEGGECTSEVVFSDFRVRRTLPAFARTTVELLPERIGEFGFACGMNMVHGRLIVEPGEGHGSSAGDGNERDARRMPDGAEATVTAVDGHTQVGAKTVSLESHPTDERAGRVALVVRGGGATCPTCLRTIESALEPLPGVRRVETDVARERATVEF